MSRALPEEDFVAWLWQQRLGGRWLRPDRGRPARLVYPGVRRSGRGPDFQGALLATAASSLVRGDVEVHVRASDWQAHGHERDPAYNAVVWHVVWEVDRDTPTRRADGATIPQLELSRHLPAALPALLAAYRANRAARPAAPAWSEEEAGRLLQAAGLARFLSKMAACEADIAALGPAQALYRRLARALGYGGNARPMERLADAVPLTELCGWLEDEGEAAAAARLLEWAGLAGRPSPLGLVRRDWQVAGLRPANLPQRRLRGLCRLVARYGARLADVLAERVVQAWQAQRPAILAAALQVADAAPAGAASEPLSLVGRARALEAVVNALLPWAAAWGSLSGRPDLASAALGCFQRLPRTAENHVAREAARLLGLGRGAARLACQQQGLLHLYQARLADPACWQRDAAGRWHWRPWVEDAAELRARGLAIPALAAQPAGAARGA